MKIRYILSNYQILVYRRIRNPLNKYLCTKVPSVPTNTLLEKKSKIKVKLDNHTINLLERLSLVKCDTNEGVKVLEDSISFADTVLHIDTTNIEPLVTVLENENLSLRNDEISQGNCQKEILKNASLTEDDYFVAPPGNIPLHNLETEEEDFDTKCTEKSTKSSS